MAPRDSSSFILPCYEAPRKPSAAQTRCTVSILLALALISVSCVIYAGITSIPPGDQEESVQRKDISAQYLINPDPCDVRTNILALIIVTTRVDGFDRRRAVRSTWGSLVTPSCGLRLLFMLGAAKGKSVQKLIDSEALLYGDIIQSDLFEDSYTTASAKSLYLFQWATTFCSQSAYTVKVDDDNWLNLPMYFQFLKEHQHTDYAFGNVSTFEVLRDPSCKNYVPREEYPDDLYPQFLTGLLYAFPTRYLDKLLRASREIPKIFNEDVYVTGLLAARANISIRNVPGYSWGTEDAIRRGNGEKCLKQYWMCLHYTRTEEFYTLWNDPCYQYQPLC